MYMNGNAIDLGQAIPVSELLALQGYDAKRVAVEKNGQIVPKDHFTTEYVGHNDKIEVVCFVGGG